MMKDLRQSIMVNVKELINKNMKKITKEIAVSIKSNMIESMNSQAVIKINTNLTPTSQPEPITPRNTTINTPSRRSK